MSEHRRAAAGAALLERPAGTPGRRAQRLAQTRRRDRRRRRLLALLVVVALAASGTATALTLLRPTGEPVPVAAAPVREQRTLLLQVVGADGTGTVNALLAASPAAQDPAASVLLVPGRVLASVPGSGTVPFDRTAALADPESSRRALADLAQVTVDAGWVLTGDGLATLVDALGGVVVDVEVEVTVPQPDGTALVLAPAGDRQELTGEVVTAYLGQSTPGSSDLARLPRLQRVLEGLMAEMPTTAEAVTGLLEGFGAGSTTTGARAEAAAVLAATARAARTDAVATDALPVLPVDSGGAEATFRVDPVGLAALVERRLADSRPPGGNVERPRVLVLNGVGTPGLGGVARDLLVADGLEFAGSSNAGTLDHSESVVLVGDSGPESRRLGARVAAALGLGPGAVQVERRGGTLAEVVVVLGADFAAEQAPPAP